jgi:quinoprotein glucose dehydrogenase
VAYLGQALFIVGWVVFGAFLAFANEPGWPVYGGDPAGTRYSAAAQITRENVGQLTVAWSYSTRDLATKGAPLSMK